MPAILEMSPPYNLPRVKLAKLDSVTANIIYFLIVCQSSFSKLLNFQLHEETVNYLVSSENSRHQLTCKEQRTESRIFYLTLNVVSVHLRPLLEIISIHFLGQFSSWNCSNYFSKAGGKSVLRKVLKVAACKLMKYQAFESRHSVIKYHIHTWDLESCARLLVPAIQLPASLVPGPATTETKGTRDEKEPYECLPYHFLLLALSASKWIMSTLSLLRSSCFSLQ